MLLHALLGCTWHQAYAHDSALQTRQHESAGYHACRHAHAQAVGGSVRECEEHDHEDCPCQEERCTYIGTKIVEPVTAQSPLSFTAEPFVGSVNATGALICPEGDRALADISSAARVRLRTGVWRL